MAHRGFTITKQIKLQRRKFAEERLAARKTRSNAEQLKMLDRRLGEGQGAKKERARLGDAPMKVPAKQRKK
jgi:hypothetical protein